MKRQHIRILLYIFLFLFIQRTSISAQHLFEYGVEEGLSDRKVISIERDLQGFTWLLTNKGVDRFDGKKFTHYKIVCQDRDYYFFPEIHKLEVDVHGNIIIMGRDGYLFRYAPEYDSFVTILDFYKENPSLTRIPIKNLYLDSKENIWILTQRKQYIYNIGENKLAQLKSSLPEDIVCITEGNGNEYYFGGNSFIHQVELSGNELKKTISGSTRKSSTLINFLYFHKPTQKLLAGTILDGAFIYDVKAEKKTELPLALKDIVINSISVNPVQTEKAIIGTDGAGAYLLDFNTLQFRNLFTDKTFYKGINDKNIIKDVLIDSEERIWAVTYPNGFIEFNPNLPNYVHIKRKTGSGTNIANNRVNHIFQDSDGDFWFASNNGLSLYNPDTQKWTVYFSNETKDASNNNHVFLTVNEISKGIIIAGGYMSGLYIINKRTNQKEYTSMKYSGQGILPDKYIRGIVKDEDGQVWIGGYYYLRRLNPKTDEVIQIRTEYPINDIKIRNSKSLWVATIHGLYIYDKLSNQLNPYLKEERIHNINSIYQTKDGLQTYIATYGNGLYILDNKTQEVQHLTMRNSKLLSNNIYAILANKEEELFLTGERAISIYNRKNGNISNWTEDGGLFKAKFNQNAICRSQMGNLLFGTSEGVFIVKENIHLSEKSSGKIILNSLTIGDEKVYPNHSGSPLKENLNKVNELTLTSAQNSFSIDISSINYDNPSSVYFSYMLEGYQSHWSKINDNSHIKYIDVKPGNYKLRIRSVRSDDYSTIEERTLKITILPPVWLTWWAITLYSLILCIILYGVIRYFILYRERKNSLEKIEFFKNTAHDIRTPLTLIQAPLNEILRKEHLSAQGKKNLQTAIQNADNLTELSTNLINFEKEELYTEKIMVTQCELNKYVQAYIKPYKEFADKKQISLVFSTDLEEDLNVWIDRNKMDSILRNLLTNALKYTLAEGVITVKTGQEKNAWTIQISDTGIGIPEKDQKQLFKVIFRGSNAVNQQITGSGIGMLLTSRLIRNHQGKITLKSKENKGTSFLLTFPTDCKHFQHITMQKELSDSVVITQEASSAIDRHPETTDKQDKTLKQYSVLIVEDNQELAEFLCQTLSDEYNVQTVTNGLEGIKTIKSTQPDLVVSDIMMPVMNGDEMCNQIKTNLSTSHIPVILLTALDDKKDILEGLENKADLYMTKPFDIEVLKANIANILANRERMKKCFSTGEIKTITKDDAIQIAAMEMVSTLDNEFIQKVTDSIHRNLTNNLTVDTICEELNMSRSSFYNKIKALSGMAPADFIRQIKMHEATLLLQTERYSVSEIAEKLGFSDPKYFSDTFKKYHHMTPTAYIKQKRKKEK